MFLGLRFSSNKTGRTSTVWTTEPHTEPGRLTDVLTVSGYSLLGLLGRGDRIAIRFQSALSNVVRAPYKTEPPSLEGYKPRGAATELRSLDWTTWKAFSKSSHIPEHPGTEARSTAVMGRSSWLLLTNSWSLVGGKSNSREMSEGPGKMWEGSSS